MTDVRFSDAARRVTRVLQAGACLIVSLWLSVGAAAAQEPAVPAGPPAVLIVDAAGATTSDTLIALGAGQVTLGSAERKRIPLADLVQIRFANHTARLAQSGPLVVLAGGDLLALQPETIDDTALVGRWVHDPEQEPVRVPLESIRGVIFERPAQAAHFARLLDLILDGKANHDTILLHNQDTLTGEFTELTATRLLLATDAGKTDIDRKGVQAVVFNPALLSDEPLRGVGALLTLTDGSRWRARELQWDGADTLTLRAQFGSQVRLSLAAVESLRILGGRATYLSDLTPSDYVFEPFFDLPWPYRSNRSVAGGPLSLRGMAYPWGLGVHSRSTLTYKLEGAARWFLATVGIDDITAGKGSVVFEVLLDGKVAFRSETLTGTTPALVIPPVDLRGVQILSLRVDFGDEADILDHADWCDALLLK